jgi:hypothetical protein
MDETCVSVKESRAMNPAFVCEQCDDGLKIMEQRAQIGLAIFLGFM